MFGLARALSGWKITFMKLETLLQTGNLELAEAAALENSRFPISRGGPRGVLMGVVTDEDFTHLG